MKNTFKITNEMEEISDDELQSYMDFDAILNKKEFIGFIKETKIFNFKHKCSKIYCFGCIHCAFRGLSITVFLAYGKCALR